MFMFYFLRKIKIPAAEKKIVKDFKNQLVFKFGEEVLSVRLFGSRVRGDHRKGSDIDILVVLKNPTEEQISYIYGLAMDLTYENDIYVSVKIFSESEFNYYKSIPTLFIQNVLKEGVIF